MQINSPQDLAPFIQHTLIKAGTTHDQIVAHAEEAVAQNFGAVMVPASWVPEVAAVVRGTGVQVASALDFPTVGVMTSYGKAREAEAIAKAGADQIDIGVQVGWLKSGREDDFRNDIAGVVEASGVPVKVMLELPLLTDEEKERAVELAMDAGAKWLKNASSGAIETASPESVRYLVERIREGVLVKASGAITGYDQAVALVEAGASALGTSAGMELVQGDTASTSY
ncbi:deoxyribose-phosphate aldolase [Ornithinimicrobium cavernae]|uniref:deoxyribose-phosphate aldolase n=1 Tax=Ornithinimicrobium cavernae TaxID=2666047 RepID=UPI000D68CB76|nr:deoxyribose-phosphate aldolase [Ornithinimicrobium cavernae]